MAGIAWHALPNVRLVPVLAIAKVARKAITFILACATLAKVGVLPAPAVPRALFAHQITP